MATAFGANREQFIHIRPIVRRFAQIKAKTQRETEISLPDEV
jgi:hypothetical protein